jgi:transcription elongation factor GreA
VEYIASLPVEIKQIHQRELSRFVRWFGGNRNPGDITGQTLETYQQQVESTGADAGRRLEPLKSFVLFLQRKGLIEKDLSKVVKAKRAASKSKRESRGETRVSFNEDVVHLTREGFDKLKAELDNLVTVVRVQVAHELAEARIDKDIRENAPYDAAKQHQALVEARIREIERALGSAQLIDAPQSNEKVTIGVTVVIRDMRFDEELRYTLVGTNEADARAGKISIASPVGKALLDKQPGEVVEVTAPAGLLHYRIERIES